MRRAWKIVLAVVGIPTFCVAVLWIDSYYRAVAAIRAEDERLAKDIAAWRSRRPRSENPAFPFEQSHTGLGTSTSRRTLDSLFRRPNAGAADEILANLVSIRNQLGEGGYWAEYYRCNLEMKRLTMLTALQDPTVLPTLDRLESTRPTVAEIVTGEHLLDRTEVLRVLHRKEDPYGMIRRPPGWREFFSWRILIAKTLRELDDHHREIQEAVANGTVRPWSHGIDNEEPHVRSRTQLRLGVRGVVDRERHETEEWTRTRSALTPK